MGEPQLGNHALPRECGRHRAGRCIAL
jgi:hypothetical protein